MARTRPSTAPQGSSAVDEEGLMRSYVKKGEFIIPQPDYEVGEKAYLQYEDRRMGTFLVYIATPGRWNSDKQDIEYQLRLGNATDGPWYKNGEWIGEKALKTK